MRLMSLPDTIDPLSDTAELGTVNEITAEITAEVDAEVDDLSGPGRDRHVLGERIDAALRATQHGQPDPARALLHLWDALARGTGPDPGPAVARCLLAHHLAALQDEAGAQLWWNLRALQAAQLATDAELAAWGLPIPARALFPLLHLRLAQTHYRAGDPARARGQLHLAHTWTTALPDDHYGHRVRADLARLVDQLDLLNRPAGAHRRG